jgi:hypothetical protein
MSTYAYAQFTNLRDHAAPGTSNTTSPGVTSYADALSALVPAEVLTVHALVISVTTKTVNGVAEITYRPTLALAFWGLVVLGVIIYAIPRATGGRWDRWDYVRMLIPALAFVGWTMLQPTSAFDAVFESVTQPQRTVAALFLAVVLGLAAGVLAYQADAKPNK